MVAAGVESILDRIMADKRSDVAYTNGSDLGAVAKLAAAADVVIVVVGSTSSEGTDRTNTSLPNNHLQYLNAAAAAAPKAKIAVVVMSPGQYI